MKLLLKIVRGVFIGIANVIPGVSGGTMMVSMGIYDEIITAVTNLLHHPIKSIRVLLPYIIGMAVGIVGLARAIEGLFANFPLQTAFVFIGLILGGVPMIFAKVKGKKLNLGRIVVFLIFFASIIILQVLKMSGSSAGNVNLAADSVGAVILIFAIGVLASATMVIPGVSGSLVMMLIGFYNPLIKTINRFVDDALALNWDGIWKGCSVLIPFGVGVVIGIFAVAKLIEILLRKAETLTYCGILGLVVASPVVVLMQTQMPKINALVLITSAITLGIGCVTSYFLGRE